MAGLTLVTKPAAEPIALPDAKKHLGISPDDTTQDGFVELLLRTSREALERQVARTFITRTYDYFLDAFPCENAIELPRPPLLSVASVKYTPDGGSQLTFASADYLVDVTGNPGRVVLGRSKSWPSDLLQSINGVVIRFDAGYGAATAVPDSIRHAILIHLGTLYEHREAVVTGTIVQPLPTVDRLLAPFVWRRVV